MPTGIDTGNIVEYAGFRFPPASRVNLSVEPVYDTSQRCVKYYNYNLQVSAFLTVHDLPNPLSPDMGLYEIQQRLLRAGQLLRLSRGLGVYPVPINEVYPDQVIGFGPLPRHLHVQPLGSTLAFLLTWECQFALPLLEVNRTSGDGLLEGTYMVSWGIDHRGLTTRTVSGRIEVWAYRHLANFNVERIADALRERISIPIASGFRRQSQSFQMSEDRRWLHFTITDVELPSRWAFPPGVANLHVEHRIYNYQPSQLLPSSGAIIWRGEISASAELWPNEAPASLWAILWGVIRSRLDAIDHWAQTHQVEAPAGGKTEGRPEEYTRQRPLFLIRTMSLAEQVYELAGSMSIAYDLQAPLGAAWEANALSTEPKGKDGKPLTWDDWYNSAAGRHRAWSIRGIAGAGTYSRQDGIIYPGYPGLVGPELFSHGLITEFFKRERERTLRPFRPPPKDSSYWHYELVVKLDEQAKTIDHPILSEVQKQIRGNAIWNDLGKRPGHIVLIGEAERVGYDIPDNERAIIKLSVNAPNNCRLQLVYGHVSPLPKRTTLSGTMNRVCWLRIYLATGPLERLNTLGDFLELDQLPTQHAARFANMFNQYAIPNTWKR
jgi:hypothetical protein